MYTTRDRNKCAAQVRALTKVILVQYIGQIHLGQPVTKHVELQVPYGTKNKFLLWIGGNL